MSAQNENNTLNKIKNNTNETNENDQPSISNIEIDNANKINYEKESKEFKDKYLRTLAELENIKKFSFKQLEDANNYAICKFAKELLTVIDVFNKALESVNNLQTNDTNFKAFIDGITLTKLELMKIFSKFNIIPLDKELIGEIFDPNYHEALIAQPVKGKNDNIIFTVFEAGYKIKEKLLRPAKVGIVKNS